MRRAYMRTVLLLPVASSVISVLEVVRLEARDVMMLNRAAASSEGLPKEGIAP